MRGFDREAARFRKMCAGPTMGGLQGRTKLQNELENLGKEQEIVQQLNEQFQDIERLLHRINADATARGSNAALPN